MKIRNLNNFEKTNEFRGPFAFITTTTDDRRMAGFSSNKEVVLQGSGKNLLGLVAVLPVAVLTCQRSEIASVLYHVVVQ